MNSRRVAALIAAAALAGGWHAPAAAQEDYQAIVTIMRACSTIADVSARVTCYDNNVRPRSDAPAVSAPARNAAPVAPSARGYGAESLPEPRRDEQQPRGDVRLSVTAAAEREPGIYLLTLEDGGQWQFVDAAPAAYDPPRRGDAVTIEPGAMGGYLMRYAGQRSIRIKRVR